MDSKSNGQSGGVGFVSLLTLLFIGLKLAGKIDWSWWWVLSPIWISFALFLVIAFIVILLATLSIRRKERRSKAFRAGTYRPDGWWK